MNGQHVPTAAALTAHVRTAVDGSVRWIDRGLRAGPGNADAWEQANFFGRMMLMRGMERGELLGWVLERDAEAEHGTERGAALRAGSSYWAEARSDLHTAIAMLRTAADLTPATARHQVQEAREHLLRSAEWLLEIAEGLGRAPLVVEVDDRRLIDRGHGIELDAG